ncbi:MAG: 50S ribosomal protein L2 [Candidatus Berkelbacteria bacterium]|nr:50S ribosomal protein L2 [Candidatus Berkelbacteria bacterium]
MAIRKLKPNMNSQRGTSYSDFSTLSKVAGPKSLRAILTKKAGRNNTGRITVAHRGGGSKRFYRIVNFGTILEESAKIVAIEYDPNRSANIALIEYSNGSQDYILAPEKAIVGTKIENKELTAVKPGNRMILKNIPVGTAVHNIELLPGQGGKLCRSAGNSATLLSIDGDIAQIKLPSSEVRRISSFCFGSIGTVGNSDTMNKAVGRAGRTRHMGIRPTVRGKAKNPCDHPHGGGEGNTSIGLTHPKTPWGMPALGYRTRNKKKKSKLMIIKRRSK